MPSVGPQKQPPWQSLVLGEPVKLPGGWTAEGSVELYTLLFRCTTGAVLASMIAYLGAQFCDVYLFHFWKRLTGGRYLWLRNNGSTMISQLVDSAAVVGITFGAALVVGEMAFHDFVELFLGNYAYKFGWALVDTVPVYLAVAVLSRYLRIDPRAEHRADVEASASGRTPKR